jgi:hypothetical protein
MPSSVEMPATPAIRTCLGELAAGQRYGIEPGLSRMLGIALVVIGFVLSASFGWPALILLVPGILLFAGIFTHGRRLDRDVDETTYLRTTGPMCFIGHEDGSALDSQTLEVAGNSCTIVERMTPWAEGQVRQLSWGTVDHSRHLKVVFEIRDKDGRAVYRNSKYRPRG